jgi:ferredoxin-NADP reductase
MLRIIYGALVGFIFIPNLHFVSIYSTPEIALVVGNIFSYLISPKHKVVMNLSQKIQIAPDIFDFSFALPDKNFNFIPGQYMEWTLPHKSPDSRGNRRYFTIASSPTEDDLRLGVKFYEDGSSFKRNLKDLNSNGIIVGGQLAGDFILPKDSTKKYIFIAGGIGITPFRSMLKYLIDKNIKLSATLLFSNKFARDIVYKDVLDEAYQKLGIKTYYTLTDEENIPQDWNGWRGRINAEMISQIPDWKSSFYYLSGPHAMVSGFEKTLSELGVGKTQIKKDFFPGFV